MDTIVIKDLHIGTSTNADGCTLKLALVPFFDRGESVLISFRDVLPMSSSFFNSSFSELIEQYGYEIFKKTVILTDLTKSHFELIKKYVSWQNNYVST
ncbi:MAG: DUF4325 domain-containing protein [Paludibacter sp.]|nr:DUF4325 domain-containing protein [Paludibacter sp.]